MATQTFEVHPEDGEDFRSLRVWLAEDTTLTDAEVTVGRPGGVEQRGGPAEAVALWLNVAFSGGSFILPLVQSIRAWLKGRTPMTRVTIKHGKSEVTVTRDMSAEEIVRVLGAMKEG